MALVATKKVVGVGRANQTIADTPAPIFIRDTMVAGIAQTAKIPALPNRPDQSRHIQKSMS